METIQATLDKLAAQSDSRTTVFDIQIQRLQHKSLTLTGRLLDKTQLETLSHHFSDLKLDTALIRVLSRSDLPRMHVSTNLTGLYERPTFGTPLSSELCYGTEVEILDEQDRWVFTRQKDGYLGWAYKPYLTESVGTEVSHLVVAPSSELRAEPDGRSEVITRVFSGTGVGVEEVHGAWARVVANKTGWTPASFLRPLSGIPESIEEKRRILVEDSARMVGVPYLWGGTSGNGIDCSGFARLLHRWVGVEIPRDADMQHATAKPVEPLFEVGDLIFFGEGNSERRVTHVGMSLGGWKMIHSSRRRNGVYIDNVQEQESLKEIYMSTGSFLREQ
jgi:cell wall-associated NlpC family hydrolase